MRNFNFSLFSTFLVLGLAFGSSKTSWRVIIKDKYNGRAQTHDSEIVSKRGVVAADDGRCSEIGASMLRKGGHAVDAAVATALCLGVVNSMSSGIGGGAFMVVSSASTSQALAFDMRETAPAAAFKVCFWLSSQTVWFSTSVKWTWLAKLVCLAKKRWSLPWIINTIFL